MKNILRIFTKDAKNTGTNWVALILIGGLILLPSLYAWFNIKASWDPYGQTDQIPIGIVNEDTGSTLRDEDINVGQELVDTLKENPSMDWQFEDKEKAMDKLEYGDYFAVIVIPENFSSKLGTVVDDQPEKADMEYYVNEKINAIAPKITDKGASALIDEISSNFISTVNGVIFETFNDIGIELEQDLPDIERFEQYIFDIEENLPEINELINQSLTDATSAEEVINRAQSLVPEAEQVTRDGLNTIDNTTAFLNEAEDRLNEMAPQIQADLERVQQVAQDTNAFLKEVQSAEIDFGNGEELTDRLDEQVAEQIENISSIENTLRQVQQQQSENKEEDNAEDSPDEGTEESNQGSQQIEQALEKLATIRAGLETAQQRSGDIRTFIEEKHAEVDGLIGDLQSIVENTSANIDSFITEYNESIEPRVLAEVANAKTTLAEARNILVEIQTAIPEVERILSSAETDLGEGKGLLETVQGEFPYVNDKVNELADRIREIQGETDIGEIIELLQNDPEAERGFFAEPVQLNENKVFPIENYGSGMTPFYTVLAIWVGGLLLISLLSTDTTNMESYSSRQVYFGKLLTFITIGLLQTTIVSLGDIFLLNVSMANPIWFVVFGLLISLVFMIIIYTLVSVFGDIGKAMVIVLLVLQIAGSGGTYPVVLLPDFFQVIHPFLPFSYAIDLLREAVGGIVWERVIRDILFLSIFGIAAIVLGAFLKQPINRQSKKIKQKSKESGMFH
ncbi:YhgE/Pip domain-containing protein [Oceanobacillus manasiensis]|uniref:YhgE/Pip domain-containing protein n=1 Tax=Oceanobacillus manasiensis TaxID=586413 RepID=UPI000A84D741|nr:YhgE/Pip domain-containing protein [Oceanobacillus manasiensis]